MDPEGFEGFNLMTAGALEDRPEKRRWTHSVWENPDGKLRRSVYSNVLFQCTDFGGMRDGGGPWRGRNLSYPRAWMAYAAHPTFNPAFLIHNTTAPHQAASHGLCGDNDWTRLEVELDSGEQAYLMPYLVLKGAGTAWFDDVSFCGI